MRTSSRPNPLQRFAKDLPTGRLEWIGVRPARRQPMQVLEKVDALESLGLAGDHRTQKTPGSARQVTVTSHEFIAQIAHYLGVSAIDPALLRRNLVVSGINLNALRYQTFSIGAAVMEAKALCHPCSSMESALGKGAVAAMLGHGGLCCEIVKSGTLQIGDEVHVIDSGITPDLFA
ncbi:MAG: MOSC domain-containing protein [Pseudomonadota bacterium]